MTLPSLRGFVASAPRRPRQVATRASAALVVVLVSLALLPGSASAESYVPVSGAGSTWSQNAIDQWRRNVNQYGLRVNYAGTGSSDGRNQFRNGTVDFAVSEIPYGLKDNNVVDTPPSRAFAYLPIVAGGTSFMYNLKVGGKRVTNLRLSPATLTKIFTGAITNWGDPAIKSDNPGLALPARRIVPVVRSDGSGTTAQFTAFMSKQQPDLWNDYCRAAGRPTPCGLTSFYPVVAGKGFTAQSGSLGVSGYVSQSQNEGTITYVEYSYALNAGFPVAKLLNKSGYYVEPGPQSVAVALLSAKIDNNPASPSYLTPDLVPVYNSADPRAYPMSSYSYMVVPTATTATFNQEKGKSLGAFAYYFLCEGQQQAPKLGYSPLPINLVKSGLDQVKKIPGVKVETVNVKSCNNPTFSADGTNTLAKTAPQPPLCDKKGPYQCPTGTGGAARTATAVLAAALLPSGGSGQPSSGPAPGGATPGGAAPGATAPSSGGASGEVPVVDDGSGGQAPPVVDSEGGVVPGGSVEGDGTVVAAPIAASPVVASATFGGQAQYTLMLLAALMLLGVVLAPPLVARALRQRGSRP